VVSPIEVIRRRRQLERRIAHLVAVRRLDRLTRPPEGPEPHPPQEG
jgi:hypothetical protein